MKVLLDMDGVLVDLVRGLARVHGQDYPYDDPDQHEYFIERVWGISTEVMWAPCDRQFWASLEPTPEAFDIVRLLESTFGRDNIVLLSTPAAHDGCMDGKLDWIKSHLPEYERRFLFGPRKEFAAAEDRLLVDDFVKNIEVFNQAGGRTCLVPRPWNYMHRSRDRVVEILAQYMQQYMAVV